jgi:hypothetical protein
VVFFSSSNNLDYSYGIIKRCDSKIKRKMRRRRKENEDICVIILIVLRINLVISRDLK